MGPREEEGLWKTKRITFPSLWRNSHPTALTLTQQLKWPIPGDASSEEPANAGDIRDSGYIPELGRCPGGGHGNPLRYSFLENLMYRRAWQATVHNVTKWLSMQTRLLDYNYACLNFHSSIFQLHKFPHSNFQHFFIYACVCKFVPFQWDGVEKKANILLRSEW